MHREGGILSLLSSAFSCVLWKEDQVLESLIKDVQNFVFDWEGVLQISHEMAFLTCSSKLSRGLKWVKEESVKHDFYRIGILNSNNTCWSFDRSYQYYKVVNKDVCKPHIVNIYT